MKFLVTGGTGFVGSAVIRKILEEGHEVKALVRKQSSRENLQGLPLEYIEGELTDEAGLCAAMKDCEGLFHVAADYRLWVPDSDSMFRANVEGTGCIMRAALQAGVERVVYCSSVSVLKTGTYEYPASESSVGSLATMIGPYKRSKFEAELLVDKMVAEQGLPAVIVNPTAPVGPRDIKPTPTGKMVIDAASGRMFAYIETGLNIVHVEDVAQGHWLAWQKGRVGERYILGGENLRLSEILARICTMSGVRPPQFAIPLALLHPIAPVVEFVARLQKREPILHRDVLQMAKNFMFFSSAKAVDELGYRPRCAGEALKDSVNWFAENAYLR